MRRVLKLLAGLLFVAVVALGAIVFLVPTKQLVELAADQIEATTGRKLAVSGNVSRSLYPVLGLTMEGVTLSNAPWGEAPHLVSAKSAAVGVELIPLLSGTLKVREVRLIEPVVALEVNADGAQNWVIETGDATADSVDAEGGSGGTPAFSLAEAVMENGAVSYRDGQTGLAIDLTAVSAKTALAALDQPVALEGSAVWQGEAVTLSGSVATPAALAEGAEAEIAVEVSAKDSTVSFEGNLAMAPGAALPTVRGRYGLASADPASVMDWATGAAPPEVAGLADFDLTGDVTLAAETLSATATGGVSRDGTRATVDLTVEGGAAWQEARSFSVVANAALETLVSFDYDGTVAMPPDAALPNIDGRYQLASADPAGVLDWATGAVPPELVGLTDLDLVGAVALSAAAVQATATGGISRDGKGATIDLSAEGGEDWQTARSFSVAAKAGLEALFSLDFNGSIAVPARGNPSLGGDLILDAPDLRGLANFAGADLPAAQDSAFRKLRLAGKLSTPTANRIRFAANEIALDEISMKGAVVVSPPKGERPLWVRANLTAGDLDLTPYVTQPGGSDSAGGEPSNAGATGWSKEPIDLTALGAANGDIKIRAKSVQAPKMRLGKSDIAAVLQDGLLTLTVTELGLYGGGVKGDISVNGKAGNALSAKISASAVRMLPMLRAFAGTESIEGRGAMEIDVTGRGESLHAIMNSLDGEGSVKLTDGALIGYNLAAMVRNLTGAFASDQSDARTDFAEVSGSFTIAKGLLENADFQFLGPLLRVFGEGSANLGKQTVDFRLTPKAVATLEGQGGATDAAGIAFPLIVRGPWENVSITPDLSAGIENILSSPGAALGAIEGVIGGGLVPGQAGDALKAITGGDGGLPSGAAKPAEDALRAITGGGASTEADDGSEEEKQQPGGGVGGLLDGILKN
ncbi:MAG: AsmA family protein [Pseudomonadota bacterium]